MKIAQNIKMSSIKLTEQVIQFIRDNAAKKTPQQIADELNVSRDTIYRYCTDNDIQCVRKLGRPVNEIDMELLRNEGHLKTCGQWALHFGVDYKVIRKRMVDNNITYKRLYRESTKKAVNDDCEVIKPEQENFQWLMPDLDVYFSRKIRHGDICVG